MMRRSDDMIQALKQVHKRLRTESTCWSCGKPRQGFRPVRGGRSQAGYDESYSSSSYYGGGSPESYDEAGLCTCPRVEFFVKGSSHRLRTHPAYGEIIEDFTVGYDGALTSVTVRTGPDTVLTVTAGDFNVPVWGQITAPAYTDETVKFDLVDIPMTVGENAADDARLERRFAEAS